MVKHSVPEKHEMMRLMRDTYTFIGTHAGSCPLLLSDRKRRVAEYALRQRLIA